MPKTAHTCWFRKRIIEASTFIVTYEFVAQFLPFFPIASQILLCLRQQNWGEGRKSQMTVEQSTDTCLIFFFSFILSKGAHYANREAESRALCLCINKVCALNYWKELHFYYTGWKKTHWNITLPYIFHYILVWSFLEISINRQVQKSSTE